jgi:PadR family transcriptional regulator PadR
MSIIDLSFGAMEFRMPSYFALATLLDGPLHGYAIVRRAGELSDGRVRLSTGTLYALLERAIEEDLVIAGEPYREGGRQRRDYALTPKGRGELEAEALRLAHAARAVTRRLRPSTTVATS